MAELNELNAELDEFIGQPCPPPFRKRTQSAKLVIEDGKPIAEAVVQVPQADPNFAASQNGVVRVRAVLVGTVDAEGKPIWPERGGAVAAYNPFARERIGFDD